MSPEGLHVDVPIYSHETDADDSVLERWQAGIDATWNDTFEVCRDEVCQPVTFAPEFRRKRQGDETVLGSSGSGRASANRWQTEDPYPIAKEDRLYNPDSVEVAAGHEFGHLMGIPDEYGRTAQAFEEITGRSPTAAEMNAGGKAADNGMGTSGMPMLPRHLDHMAEWVNEIDPAGGEVSIRQRPDLQCENPVD